MFSFYRLAHFLILLYTHRRLRLKYSRLYIISSILTVTVHHSLQQQYYYKKHLEERKLNKYHHTGEKLLGASCIPTPGTTSHITACQVPGHCSSKLAFISTCSPSLCQSRAGLHPHHHVNFKINFSDFEGGVIAEVRVIYH